MPKISVIVPVYNAATLVARCIDSILSQTFTDYELIMIDDGSTDHSLQVLREYATKDARIVVFHKENGGQTSARRYGVEHSTGEYVNFIDADDFIPKSALEEMYEKAIEKDLDIVDGASISYYEDFTIKETITYPHEGEFNNIDYLKLMYSDKSQQGTHASLFRKTLFTPEVFDIPKDVRLGEDFYFHLCMAINAAKCGIYNNMVYYYVLNKNSITNYYQYVSIRPQEYQIECIRRILNKYHFFDIFKDEFYKRGIGSLAVACMHNRKLLNDSYVKRFVTEAYPYSKTFYLKVQCWILKYPMLYPLFYQINKIRKSIL